MPEKMESLCQYLVGGEYCIFNKTDESGGNIVPSGTAYLDEFHDEIYPTPPTISTKSTLPGPDVPSRICQLAYKLKVPTINNTGKAQKACTQFVPSTNPRNWEQVTPIEREIPWFTWVNKP